MIVHSVIIPFRDKFTLMEKAIASVPDRSDVQLILIYNGAEAFPSENIPSKQHSTVTFLTSDSAKGAGHARNVGLSSIQGEYVHFLDADDYFTPDAFEAFDSYVGKGYDIVFFKSTGIFLKSGAPSDRHQYYCDLVDEFCSEGKTDALRYRWMVPWGKMIKVSLIRDHDINFEEVRVSNDARFSMMIGHFAAEVCADPAVVYVITEGEAGESLVKSRSAENMFIRYQVQIRCNAFLKSAGHFDQRTRLLGALRVALKEFGLREFFKYLFYAVKTRSWIF